MAGLPHYDRAIRRRLLEKVRVDRRRAWAHALSPAQRLERALGIIDLAHATRALRPPIARAADESIALWVAIKGRLRDADARR